MDVLLFPLVNVTLFPRTTKPLNIFEPRYLSMVRYSLQSGIPIAIAFIEDASSQQNIKVGDHVSFVRPIAGYGNSQIIEDRTNGTLLIFLQGLGKVKLGAVKEAGDGFFVCEADSITEDLVVKHEEQNKLSQLQKILVRWIRTHIPDLMQQEVFLKNMSGAEEIVGAFGSYLVRDYDLQQMVLEFDDINEKINFLHRLLASAEITA